MHSQPPPKGSLEDLFRHHLLESEAAAVPPRPLVWEHIDNSLLLAQNEKYRRRLLVHRWGMAASLLLAALAGGGWWHSQQAGTATLASAHAQHDAARLAVTGAVGHHASRATAAAPTGTPGLASRAAGTAGAVATGHSEAEQSGALAAGALGRNEQASQRMGTTWPATARAAGRGRLGATTGTVAYASADYPAFGARWAAGSTEARTVTFSSPKPHAIAATATSSTTSFGALPGVTYATGGEEAPLEAADAATALADSRSAEAALSARLVGLALTAAAPPPAELALKELAPPTPTLLRHWRYGAEYAITAFQPNIDFNRGASDYNPALGFNTVSLTRAAAAEYRANLRPGLGQRLTLRATRWLGGHWSLSTGLEVAQQEAYSATSASFTGEQLADFSNTALSNSSSNSSSATASRDLHDSSFRYRSAGIPLELQYDNQAKSGISFYGRLGAIVSALLSVRSEVAGNAEATRTYSLTSASTPYRRLTALLRGSAGVRYRPAGRGWGLNVGPTAEAGVQSLNSETDRSFLQQRRPYSVGIEAGIEFGGGFKPVPASN